MTFASAPIAADEQPRSGGSAANGTALLLGCWAIVACSSLVAGFGRLPDGLSNDDAMRLVGIRDLLAGQPWFDLMQYRLGPSGSLMHWSRLIDLPIALFLKFFNLFTDMPVAERLTMAVWPLLVLLPVLAGMRALGRTLHNAAAGNLALVLGMFLAPLLGHFRPGALDHHNVQIALVLWATLWTVRLTGRDAVFAGCAMGVSLTIGLEMLPAIAVLAASVAVRWIADGKGLRRETVSFALSFAGATGVLAVATIPPARWAVVACDALSIAHLTAAAVGGAGLALLAAVCSDRSRKVRLCASACLAAATLAAVALVAPECLADPYAGVHPLLQEFWLANVAETQSILSLLRDEPVEALALYVPPLVALGLAVRIATSARTEMRRWLTAAALQLVLVVVAMWESRGASAGNFVAAALLAAGLLKLLPPRSGAALVFGQRGASLAAALLLTPLLLAAAGFSAAAAVQWARDTPQTPAITSRMKCRDVSAFSVLDALPAGRVLAFIDSGASILLQTRHSVLAAPYHRNNEGNLAAASAFLAPPAIAGANIRRSDIDYVVFCPGAPEFRYLRQDSPDGLAAQLARDHVPEYLQRLPLGDGALQVYRVIKGDGDAGQ